MPSAAGRQRQQGDRAHGRGAQDTRRGPGEHDERNEHEPSDRGPPAQADPEPPADDQDGAEDDRHVGPADGDDVGEPHRAEVVLERGVEPAGVAIDEARQQPPLVRRQRAGGVPESGPQPTGEPLQGRSVTNDRRPPAGRQQGSDVVATGRRLQPTLGPDALTREQPHPPLVRGQHQDRLAQSDVAAGDQQALDPQVRDHQRPEGEDIGLRRREPRVVGQDALDGHRSAGPRRNRQRPRFTRMHPGGGREASGSGADAHGRCQRGGPGPRPDQDAQPDQEHRHSTEQHGARRDEPGLPGNQPGGDRRQGQPQVQRLPLAHGAHTRTRALSC